MMLTKSDIWAIYENTLTPSIIIDAEKASMKVLKTNPTFCHLAGKPSSFFEGAKIKDAFEPFISTNNNELLDDLLDSLMLVRTTKRPHDMKVQRVYLPTQTTGSLRERKWKITHTPVIGGANKLKSIILSITDVTEQIHLHQKDIGIYTETISKVTRILLEDSDNLEVFKKVFSLTGNAILVDRISFYRFKTDPSHENLRLLAQWNNPDNDIREDLQELNFQDFKPALPNLEKNKLFKTKTQELKKGSLKERMMLRKTQSFILFPLFCNKKLWGCITFEDCQQERLWNLEDVTFLKTIVDNLTITLERVINKKALSESEDRFHAVINNIPGIAYRCLFDEQWTMVYIHEEIYNFTGYPASDFINNKVRPISSIVHPDDFHGINEVIESREDFFQFNYRLICADGSIKWVEDRGVKVYENGKVKYLEGVVWDNTEKVEAEEKLKLTQRKFQSMIQKGGDLVAIGDEKGNFKFASENYQTILGYKSEDLLGKNAADFIHPDDISQVRNDISVVPDGDSAEIQFKTKHYRFRNAAGEWRWLESTVTDLTGDVAVQGTIVNSQDITDKMESAERLRLTHRKYKSLIQKGGELFAISDEEGNFKFISENYLPLLGYKEEDLLGISAFEFIHHEDLPNLVEEFETLGDKKQVQFSPFRFRNSKNEWRWIESIITDLLHDKAVKGIVINSRDITDRVAEINRLKLMEKVTTNTNDGVAIIEQKNESFFEGEIIYINEALSNLSGFDSSEILGRQTQDFFNQVKDKAYLEEAIKKFNPFGHNMFEVEKIHKNGTSFWVNLEIFPVKDHQGIISHYVLTEKNITQDKKIELRKNLLDSLKSSFNLHSGIKDTLQEVLQILNEYTDLSLSEAWLVSRDESKITLVTQYPTDKAGRSFLEDSHETNEFSLGEGLPGITWKTAKAQYLDMIQNHPDFERRHHAEKHDLSFAYSIPLTSSGKVLGVLTFMTTRSLQNRVHQFGETLQEVGNALGLELERKQALQELQNFFELSQDMMCILHRDIFHKVNLGFTKVLGYEREEILHRSLSEFIHPDDLEATEAELANNLAGKSTLYFENRYIAKNGEIKWIAWSTASDPKEQVLYGIGKDITVSKEIEENLVSMNRKLNTAQTIGKVGYWSYDVKTQTMEWTDEVFNIYGKDKNTFTPNYSSILSFIHPEDRPGITVNDKVFPTKDTYEYHHRLIMDNGTTKYVIQKINVKYSRNRSVVGWEGVIQDITEIKRWQLALNVSNEKYKLAMEATSEMLWEWQIDEDTVHRGQAYLTLLGERFRKSCLQDWLDIIHPEDRQRVEESIDTALQDKFQLQWKAEYRVQKKDGEMAYIVDRGSIMRNPSGRAIRIIGAALDVSNSRQMIERIKKQNQALRDIAWTQSHVVRAPLARLKGLINLLEGESQEEAFEVFKEMLPHIKNSTDELDRVISNVVEKTEKMD